MNIFEKIFPSRTFGLEHESFDPRDVWEDEILGGEEEVVLPDSYRTEGLHYEPQGGYPLCVSFATTTLAELAYRRATDGINCSFSQPHLFVHADGSKKGSGFRANLNVLVDKDRGSISYAKSPMPDVNFGSPKDWLETMRAKNLAIPFEDAKRISGYVRVASTPEALKKAILKYGAVLVGVAAGSGDYYKGNGKRVKQEDNHAVLLVGWTPTSWIIFDSLWWVKKTLGYGTLDRTYTFSSVYAITSLPENWKEIRDTARKGEWSNVLNHYGLREDKAKEILVSYELLKTFEKPANKSLSPVAGRFWTVYINAITYGGYTYTDVVNDAYNWYKKGEHIFDLDGETREQWRKRLMSIG